MREKTTRQAFGLMLAIAVVGCLFSSDVQAKVKGTNIFTTPDATVCDPPTFNAKPKVPVPADALVPDGEMPRDQDVNSIPSLTGDQRKQIGKLFGDSRKTTQPMRDEIGALEARQKELKKVTDKAKQDAIDKAKQVADDKANLDAPGKLLVADKAKTSDTMKPAKIGDSNDASKAAAAESTALSIARTAPKPTTPSHRDLFDAKAATMSSPEIDARLVVVRQQLKDENNKLTHDLTAVLTAAQLNEYDEMRHGKLTILSDSRTDQGPPPPAKPANSQSGKSQSGATAKAPTENPHLHLRNASNTSHDMWQFWWGLR